MWLPFLRLSDAGFDLLGTRMPGHGVPGQAYATVEFARQVSRQGGQ